MQAKETNTQKGIRGIKTHKTCPILTSTLVQGESENELQTPLILLYLSDIVFFTN